MTFKGNSLLETEEQEAKRLARSPEGSENYFLSTLPRTIHGDPKGKIIKLPSPDDSNDLVVVPLNYSNPSTTRERKPGEKILMNGRWECIVVGGDHPSYRVGGYNIVVSDSSLCRGERMEAEGYKGVEEVDLKRVAGAAYNELNRQDDHDRVRGVGNAGDGYASVRGDVQLQDLVRAVLAAAGVRID